MPVAVELCMKPLGARTRSRRLAGHLVAVAAAFALPGAGAIEAFAAGDARTISFYHIHTKETLTVTYKNGGRFVPEALQKINWIMRDWRENKEIAIDPETIDIIWEMHEELGSKEPVNIICGYRSRGTNEMLRRTRGGQASQSQHITGKAVDISFPDVPLRRMRYSAMIRERGGVGYYPTSGVPFVHVDTARVRHWPRMVRDELALIFPSGRSQHEPSDGRPLSPSDVQRARERNKDLAKEVAAFFDLRATPKAAPVLVADASLPSPPQPRLASRPINKDQRMSVGGPPPREAVAPEVRASIAEPKLVAAPRLVERPSRFTARSLTRDRARLDHLVTLAAFEAPVEAAATPAAAIATASISSAPKPPVEMAAVTTATSLSPNPLAAAALSTRTSWVAQPGFDEDHPEEMTYRPFPLVPLMTETASFDDPSLAELVHPDAAKTLELIDDEGSIAPMMLGPGRQVATLLWAQEFRGEAVSISRIGGTPTEAAPNGSTRLASRSVTTRLSR